MQDFFQKNNKNDSKLFKAIERACEGLIYISETDAPVVAFAGGQADSVTAEAILQQTGKPVDEPVEERDFDELFTRLTAEREWYGEVEKARAKKFLELQKLLEENLHSLKVIRTGRIRITVFAVGLDKDSTLMGVSTFAVET